jgi:hypothetical protein
LDDLIVGTPQSDLNGKKIVGKPYVIFGKTDNTAINLSAIGTGGFVINGEITISVNNKTPCATGNSR